VYQPALTFAAGLAVLAAALTGSAALTVPALATTTTWSVTPGGNVEAEGAHTAVISDTTTGFKLICPQSGLRGKLSKGSGLSFQIGKVAFYAEICYPPGGGTGVGLSSTSLGPLHAFSYDAATGRTAGNTRNAFVLSGSSCRAEVEGSSAGASGLRFTCTNATGVLSVTSKPGLTFQDISGCAGVLGVNDGDAATFHVASGITPAQTITSS
jgi:hypothetical protein